MKLKDIVFVLIVTAAFMPFFTSESIFHMYLDFNHTHPMLMSFFKFAVLATLGESIGLRIKKGIYSERGFGILPRAIVWGVIGLAIKLAFTTFYHGVPLFLEYDLGFEGARKYLAGPLSVNKVAVAFAISTAMNLIFAPMMMTFHKITDTHIEQTGGTLRGFFTPLPFGQIIRNLNWKVQYEFVFKKTIPLFWIPAHTITFLLPVDFQVLFAAVLGIMLGVILAIAAILSRN